MIPGAEPIHLDGKWGHGVLLLHGFGDTPQTLSALAQYLHSSGYRVSVPLYPGHGTTEEDFFSSRAEDWIQGARDAFVALRSVTDSVSVVGLSMGAAIACALAAECQNIPSLVLLSPYLRVPLWIRAVLSVRALWSPFARTTGAKHPDSIQDPVEREQNLGYGVVNARVMSELVRAVRMGWDALPAVKSPTLIVRSRNDPRVSEATALMAQWRLGARAKALVRTETGGHIITVDYGREEVFAETLRWISRWSGSHAKK